MAMSEQTQIPGFERRWPIALAIIAALFLLAVLPGRIKMFPSWVPFAVGIVVLGSMSAAGLTHARPRYLLIERWITLLYVVLAGVSMLAILAYLVRAMVFRPTEVTGLQLLTSGIAVWVTNVLIFSLLYWQIDRGGPGARGGRASALPDWLFPQVGAPESAPPGWRPRFVDYLSLGYSTATAFSATEVAPLTSRAKLLMMLESTISLVTLVLVASRAINILGN
jgi:hypothetical protein